MKWALTPNAFPFNEVESSSTTLLFLIELKSLFQKNDLENPPAFKISSNGPYIYALDARKYVPIWGNFEDRWIFHVTLTIRNGL